MMRRITLYVEQSTLDAIHRLTVAAGLERQSDESVANLALGLGLHDELEMYRTLAEIAESPTPAPNAAPMSEPSCQMPASR